jgi:hypothetical protein
VALEACYYHAIRFAVERRLPRLSLGAVRPVLTDGVLRYKRKWGGRVAALIGTTADPVDVQLARLDVPGLAALACLVDGAAPASAPVAPFTPVTLVAPGDVWPPEARAD